MSELAPVVRKSEIAALLEASWSGEDSLVQHLSAITNATANSLIFAAGERQLGQAMASKAGLILAPLGSDRDDRFLLVRNPRTAFAQVYRNFFDRRGGGQVHPTAVIEQGAVLGEGCVIGPRVVIHAAATLGRRVIVQAGAVLGSDGFGYARTAEGYIPFPQLGTLWIGDDVEIGANATIDRGALGETRIGRGTKIDNLVHIGHNCVIGEDVMIAAQVGLAGSCVVEDGAMLGGQAGLGESARIGRGVILGGQGGVLPGKALEGDGVVYWGTPAQPVREYLRGLARMRKS